MGILLGSEKCYRKRDIKARGLSVFLEWFEPKTNELGVGEPAMILTRSDRFGLSGNRGCATIMLDQAHLYADSKTGGPTLYCIQFAAKAAEELGLEPSKQNIFKIASTIVEWLPDLLTMPPAPNPDRFVSRKAAPAAEFELMDGGKTIAEGEVLH